jgi:hypothetical protein
LNGLPRTIQRREFSDFRKKSSEQHYVRFLFHAIFRDASREPLHSEKVA